MRSWRLSPSKAKCSGWTRFFARTSSPANVVVDLDVVHRELRWRLGSRQKPEARSGLEEAIDAGVLTLIAPNFLKLEIEKYLDVIANDTGATFDEAQREWELFQAKLCFYQPLAHVADIGVVDPKDLPYKHASDELALPVYTRDPHLQKMGAPVMWVCIDTVCRDHARATSVRLGFMVGSTYTVTVGVEAFKAALRGIKSLFEGFRSLPSWLQFAIGASVAAALIHPKSRAKLLQGWNSVHDAATKFKGSLFEGFLILMYQLAEAESAAENAHRQIQSALPPALKASAIVYARRVCVLSQAPLTVREIVCRMRDEGYVPRGQNPDAYLRRVMRQSGQFTADSSGRWTLHN
jgi:hypothetical protein